jgi:nicotinamidase-related amidase
MRTVPPRRTGLRTIWHGICDAHLDTSEVPTMLLDAEPFPIDVVAERTALVVIDMQRDFLEPGGFGESLGNDVGLLRAAIGPCRRVIEAARASGLLVIHTREGHRPDLADAPPAKVHRGNPALRIGDDGPMGRILIRGEPGHDIVADLYPAPGEPVIDKPGKGAFYQTDLELMLRNRRIEVLLVCGVTTEVCVHTTIREGNDRGFRCVAIADACGSYFPDFHRVGLEMIKAQGGIFGWVSDSDRAARALGAAT